MLTNLDSTLVRRNHTSDNELKQNFFYDYIGSGTHARFNQRLKNEIYCRRQCLKSHKK